MLPALARVGSGDGDIARQLRRSGYSAVGRWKDYRVTDAATKSHHLPPGETDVGSGGFTSGHFRAPCRFNPGKILIRMKVLSGKNCLSLDR